MRTALIICFKLAWGIYLVLTSIYCLLAFFPYTYFALIKSPAYAWMPWFAQHQGVLFVVLLFGITIAEWTPKKSWGDFLLLGVLLAIGFYLTIRPVMPSLRDDWTAYRWSLVALMPLALTAAIDLARRRPAGGSINRDESMFPYSTVVLIGVSVSLVCLASSTLRDLIEKRVARVDWANFELMAWELVSHVLLAVIVFSILNLILLIGQRTGHPRGFDWTCISGLVFVILWIILLRFLNSAFSFSGLASHLYAASMAATLTLWAASLVLPFVTTTQSGQQAQRRRRRLMSAVIAVGLSLFAVALPTLISGSDWNGLLEGGFALAFWTALSICFCVLRPRRKCYSAVAILAVVLLSGFTYKMLQATEIFWAKPLGSTDDEISRTIENYAAQNASFQLAHHILGNAREQPPCGDFCRILREYSNIRDAEVKTDFQLVEHLLPSRGERPNIFFFVIDSLRPDYLGAYNPQVDFTPNLDALARDSVVVHNVYTQYAGTSLSEPAIWAGAMLLHAHYMQPFAKVNGLEKLARTDGYRVAVSYDEVLSQLLSSDELVKLDTDQKLWNQLEVCSTIKQVETLFDRTPATDQPWLFYTQPKNVHQFAHNSMPGMTTENWRTHTAFNNRIAYEVHQVDGCLGGFFAYLKAHGLYDNSIIILTSDHGDATGEFGRYSHSISIWPEIMRVPLIVHLPGKMRDKVIHDDSQLSALTDITPSLYYLLGHRPLRSNPIFGHPLFVETQEELKRNKRGELFLASDERAVYGLLTDNGKFLYTTYDSPAQSFLFDLSHDQNAEHNLLTDALKQQYDRRIIDYLHTIADFYGYTPGVGSLLAEAH